MVCWGRLRASGPHKNTNGDFCDFKILEKEELVILTISDGVGSNPCDWKASKISCQNFIDEFGNPYSRILIDKDGTLGVEFGAFGVPETFLIDRNKKIIKKFIGPIDQEAVNKIKLMIK